MWETGCPWVRVEYRCVVIKCAAIVQDEAMLSITPLLRHFEAAECHILIIKQGLIQCRCISYGLIQGQCRAWRHVCNAIPQWTVCPPLVLISRMFRCVYCFSLHLALDVQRSAVERGSRLKGG